ncbi:hypothetical protein LguiA_021779 [Lonicera macranthoides]
MCLVDMIELVNGFGMQQGTSMRFNKVYMAYVVSSLHLEHVVHVCFIIVTTRRLEDILASRNILISYDVIIISWENYISSP